MRFQRQKLILLASDRDFIDRCYVLAEQAVDQGNHPFGALLVVDSEVVLEAQNSVVSDQDISCHAEMNLVRAAGHKFERATLNCAMCAGAIYWAGLTRLVFGVSGADLGQIAGKSFVWSSAELFDRGQNNIQVIGPINAITGRKLHQAFWR
jgi:tRNA(Arg) A34 adenosine deaminase TadA